MGRRLITHTMRWMQRGILLGFLLVTPQSGVAAEPTPAEPSATPAPVAPAAPVTAVDGGHDAKLRELEEKVVDLKEKVFRSKTRLMLLKERLLNDVIAEAKVVIVHENKMGSSLKPVQVLYHLDGEKIYFQDESTGRLEASNKVEILSQNLVPGNHVLSVEMVYRGDSGLFAYLKDYLFKLRSSYTFYATKGKITTVRSIGYQKGDITYDLRERPSIGFEIDQVGYTNAEAAKAPTPSTDTTPKAPPTATEPTPTPSSSPAPASEGAPQ